MVCLMLNHWGICYWEVVHNYWEVVQLVVSVVVLLIHFIHSICFFWAAWNSSTYLFDEIFNIFSFLIKNIVVSLFFIKEFYSFYKSPKFSLVFYILNKKLKQVCDWGYLKKYSHPFSSAMHLTINTLEYIGSFYWFFLVHNTFCLLSMYRNEYSKGLYYTLLSLTLFEEANDPPIHHPKVGAWVLERLRRLFQGRAN